LWQDAFLRVAGRVTNVRLVSEGINELIDRLEAVRLKVGGDCPVVMADGEPVVLVVPEMRRDLEALMVSGEDVHHQFVVITDRFADVPEEPDE
jgi:hypothetical protein